MLETYGLLLLGLVLVMFGADSFLRGASGLAQGRGVGGFSAGLAVVAVGASVPELTIAVVAVVRGHDALAVGTVIGSCITNLGLIIGVSALVKPLATSFRMLGVALPVLIAATAALLLMGQDGSLGQIDGSLLLLTAAAFGWLVKRSSVQESEAVRKELAYAANTQTEILRNLLRIVVGLGLLGYGAWRSVGAAVDIAAHFRMNELWIGLSVLALGAALPELAKSIVAAARGHGNVVVGSAVASSRFIRVAVGQSRASASLIGATECASAWISAMRIVTPAWRRPRVFSPAARGPFAPRRSRRAAPAPG